VIEFQDGSQTDDVLDEDLPQPDERSPRRGRRRLLAGVGVLAVVAGLVTYTQLATRSDRPQAQPSASKSPSPVYVSPSTPGLLIEHLGDPNTHAQDVEVDVPSHLTPPPCPQAGDGFDGCGVSTTAPTAFTAAVRARFPDAALGGVSTATLRAADAGTIPGLWSRIYRAELGQSILTVLVRRAEPQSEIAPIRVELGDRSVIYLRHVGAHYTVEIEVSSPGRVAVSPALLERLAADARLVAA
jgi:hypothetical protein